ncbi:MAG: hypothetical protein ACOCZM_03480 [Bacillota bacterium]
MNLNSAAQSQIDSVRQAMGMMGMEQAMNRDGATADKLLEGMEETSQAIQEVREASHLGNNVDVRVG